MRANFLASIFLAVKRAKDTAGLRFEPDTFNVAAIAR
jgi:hypothetical protein